MFLSTENPPNDPLSSSSNFLHLTTSSSHELGQSHLSNFSIRDYAYSNRKKNIKNSWPFSSKSFQLVSSHGVTNPLPPFQKFSSVTNQFETTTACSSSSSSGKQIVSYVHQGRSLPKLAETGKGVCRQSKIVENGLFPRTSQVSKSQVKIVVATTSNNNNKNSHSKKSGRGMVKSKEDSCGGGLVTTTSESIMASKTCPICKTFSSASNTTLNAHIDQCLSADTALPPVCSKPNKPRITKPDQCLSIDTALPPPPVCSKPNKPRITKPQMKVKTMVDIYASAKPCTLEELDERNGTKWASILSYTNRVVADKSSEVSKKRKVSPPVGVGPVYIDAKGQKLRILSEFGEKKISSTTSLREQQQEDGRSEKKSLGQGSKGNSKCLRKRRRGKKHHKYLKLTNHKADASEKPESGSNMGHRRIYNQRMLAKRGLISKKLNEKGHKFYAVRDQPSENDDDDSSWSGGDPIVFRGTDLSATGSSPLKKLKLRNEVAGKNKTLFRSKSAQSRPFRVRISEKEEESLGGVHLNTVQWKKRCASIQENKYRPGKNFCSDAAEVSDASPRPTSKRKLSLSPPFVANSWRRLSMPVELKKARLDFSEKEDDEEETGKWESEMTQERELSDDDYVSGDNGEANEVLLKSNPPSSGYDDYDDDEEESSEDEANNNKGANVLDKTDDTGAEFYQSDTTPSIETIPTERAMYYSEEVGNMIYGQTVCEEDVRFDSEVGQRGLFVEVDTIPIPGPPGSFLPSPRDMGFDENLGNSSVITSQVQSSMDQVDRNSSESPVSAVSNFAAGRLNFHAELSSFRENFSSDVPASSYSTTPMSFSVPSHQGTIADAEPITIDKTTPSRFRNNDHDESCCCQRKERISEGITLNHQASHLLQRRTASSVAMNLTKSPTCLDPNHPFEQSPYTILQDLDLQSKFSNSTKLNNIVPPSPNPVLRLMGKDLMVMNQGEEDNEEASRSSLTPRPQFLDPPPCAGTGLYFNTGLYLRNSFESTHQPQSSNAQASAVRNNFDHVRYFSPS